MAYTMHRLRRTIFFISIFILSAAIVFSLLFAGSYLIKSDKLQKADAIVVLMGSIPDRLLYASDLYQQGWAGKVIFVEEYNESLNLLKFRGITIKSSSQQMANAAIQLGIHPDSLIIIPGDAQSTQMEAQQLRKFL
ncbi:MAG: YdcF family protein, partial [Bacteroidia bacterium]|nr:YdcF family protein [Bacteroidia bacterium]